MAWLHAWSGLIVGWVLFAIFVTGTASYYRADITRWMQPELNRNADTRPEALAAAAERAVTHLQTHASESRAWFIGLPQADKPVLDLFWRAKPGSPFGEAQLDPETGAPIQARGTKGGDFLYLFHFQLHMTPLWGRWIVGICAMIMFVALLSGIVTHRRIFADFFTFRRSKAAQRGWLDAHNVTGVLALPFHLMITYTGFITLATLYMPWGVSVAYKGDAQAYFAETGAISPPRRPSGKPGDLVPVGPIVLQALAMRSEPLERLTVNNPKDANATVVAVFEEPHGIVHHHPQIAFDGTNGAVITTLDGDYEPAMKTVGAMIGLHEAHFAGPALRVLFFLCGVMGCAMIATGLVLWSVARLPKAGERRGFGLRLVQALNIGTVAGMPAGVASFFLANRLLPVTLSGRADYEIWAFFGAWTLVALAALFMPERQAWKRTLLTAAMLFLAVPVVDAATFGLSSGAGDAALHRWFALAMIALAGGLAFAALKVERYQGPSRERRKDAGEIAIGRAG